MATVTECPECRQRRRTTKAREWQEADDREERTKILLGTFPYDIDAKENRAEFENLPKWQLERYLDYLVAYRNAERAVCMNCGAIPPFVGSGSHLTAFRYAREEAGVELPKCRK